LITLKAKSLVTLDPSVELLEQLKAIGVQPIIRGFLPANRFWGEEISRTLTKLKEHAIPIINQPFNEVNLLSNTNESPRSPTDHISQDFIPAAELIDSYGGLTLLTPLAQRAQTTINNFQYDDTLYFRYQLTALKKQKSVNWIRNRVAIGFHSYTFSPNESPHKRIYAAHQLTKDILGISLPFYVTEGGLFQDTDQVYPEAVVSESTVSLLSSSLPKETKVESFCLWVLANMAQRPADNELTEELKDFEVAAWRISPEETRQVYKAVAELVA
jgi:hypothetical protein